MKVSYSWQGIICDLQNFEVIHVCACTRACKYSTSGWYICGLQFLMGKQMNKILLKGIHAKIPFLKYKGDILKMEFH